MLALVQPKLSKEQKAVAKYIADIKPEIANPAPIAPPPGGGHDRPGPAARLD